MLYEVLRLHGISNAEAKVVELVARGLRSKDIAERLYVTEKTIKFHLTAVYKKMKVKSRAQLMVWCIPHLTFEEKTEIIEEVEEANALPRGRK